MSVGEEKLYKRAKMKIWVVIKVVILLSLLSELQNTLVVGQQDSGRIWATLLYDMSVLLLDITILGLD